MMANSRRCSDEHTRTRLLNSLGYFQKPTNTINDRVDRPSNRSSSLLTAVPFCKTSSRPFVSSHHHPHRRKPSILGDATPIVMKLNDDWDDGGIDKSLSFASTSPTSCTTDISLSNNNNNIKHNESQCNQMQQPPTDVTGLATVTATASTTNVATIPIVQFNEQVSVMSIPSRYQYSNRIKKCLWSNVQELTEMAERNVIEFSAEGWDWKNVVMDEDMYVDSLTGNLIHPCHLQDGQQHFFHDDDQDDDDDDDQDDDDDDDQDYADHRDSFQPLKRHPCVTAGSTTA